MRALSRIGITLALKRARLREDRITQAYFNQAMDLNRHKIEMGLMRARTKELEGALP